MQFASWDTIESYSKWSPNWLKSFIALLPFKTGKLVKRKCLGKIEPDKNIKETSLIL